MKAQLPLNLLVKMVIGILLVIFAFSLGKSCAEAIIPSASESVTSFNNFVNVIENTKNWAPQTQQNVRLVMDTNTAIFGFGKGADLIEKVGLSPYKINRPKSCGEQSLACVCRCIITKQAAPPSREESPAPPNRDTSTPRDTPTSGATDSVTADILPDVYDLERFSCKSETLRCNPFDAAVDFRPKIDMVKMIPSETSPVFGNNFISSLLVGGFVIERPDKNSFFLSERFVSLEQDIPRRFSVSIEKTDDNTLVVCARKPCVEPQKIEI